MILNRHSKIFQVFLPPGSMDFTVKTRDKQYVTCKRLILSLSSSKKLNSYNSNNLTLQLGQAVQAGDFDSIGLVLGESTIQPWSVLLPNSSFYSVTMEIHWTKINAHFFLFTSSFATDIYLQLLTDISTATYGHIHHYLRTPLPLPTDMSTATYGHIHHYFRTYPPQLSGIFIATYGHNTATYTSTATYEHISCYLRTYILLLTEILQ